MLRFIYGDTILFFIHPSYECVRVTLAFWEKRYCKQASLSHFVSMTNFSRLNVDVAFHFMGTQFC